LQFILISAILGISIITFVTNLYFYRLLGGILALIFENVENVLSGGPLKESLDEIHPLAFPLFTLFGPKILGKGEQVTEAKVSDTVKRLKEWS